MELIIIHYHLRPGGVRRVIEMAAPHILRAEKGFRKVILASGEEPDAPWLEEFRRLISPVDVQAVIHPAFGYYSEQDAGPANQLRTLASCLDGILGTPDQKLVWAHNLGLGRNLLLARGVARKCLRYRHPLVLHHHDWWFENRWQRWPELKHCGARTVGQVAEAIFPGAGTVRHATISRADARVLERHFPGRVSWLPNPVERGRPVSAERARLARRWLHERLGSSAPVWIVPCRLLRRKNLAEALLLTRWLRPEARLVTTGGVSSSDEQGYARRLGEEAKKSGWPLHLGILAAAGGGAPSVRELLAASEAVLLTSVQEGFGLPNLEAAAAGRPLITRNLPNISPDLAEFGFRFPQSYDEILIAPELIDWQAERQRQSRLYSCWLSQLPRPVRRLAGEPAMLVAEPGPIAFSRLTLEAQLQVLGEDAGASWRRCAPLNPALRAWKTRASKRTLQVAPWPAKADRMLAGAAYAARLLKPPGGQTSSRADARAAQHAFLCERLPSDWLYPLLWDLRS